MKEQADIVASMKRTRRRDGEASRPSPPDKERLPLRHGSGEKPGLARIEFLLNRLGRPQDAFAAVHVAGTNGKGSTAAMIASVLHAAGRRVGLFTSPHLLRYNERIVVDGAPIGDEELHGVLSDVAPLCDEAAGMPGVGRPTEFEVATAAALLHFARARVDVAVVEVGLGGRLDATNVVRPAASVITPVDLDHTGVLGTTVAAVAAEKAGIVRPGVPVVVAKQKAAAEDVLRKAAQAAGAPMYRQSVDFDGECIGVDMDGTVARVRLPRLGPGSSEERPAGEDNGASAILSDVRLPLVGPHQADNAAVAAAAALVADPELARRPDREAVLRTGFARVRWPGRFEVIAQNPVTVVDGAHNRAAAEALARTVGRVLAGRPVVFVIGMLAEKTPRDILQPLLPFASAVVCTEPSEGRTPPLPADALTRAVERMLSRLPRGTAASREGPFLETEPRPGKATSRARRLAGPDGVVIVGGSLYLVGEVKALFAGN